MSLRSYRNISDKHARMSAASSPVINDLHQQGEMSSQDQGWNVVRALYDKLGIAREGYFGGEVILAPFDVEMIAQIPKTVYAFNPMFFVCESFEQMDALLDSYLKPIAERSS